MAEQKYLVKLSRLSKCDDALVVPSFTLIVTGSGLADAALLPKIDEEITNLLSNFPAALSPMTDEEIEEYKETLSEADA
jgi:hypothetical protein